MTSTPLSASGTECFTRTIYWCPRPSTSPYEHVSIGVALRIGTGTIAFRWLADLVPLARLYGPSTLDVLPQLIRNAELDLSHGEIPQSPSLYLSPERQIQLVKPLDNVGVGPQLEHIFTEQVPAHRPAPTPPFSSLLFSLAQDSSLAFDTLTQRIYALQDEIRDAQPKLSGSVLMKLHSHTPPCLGCPHVTWRQWVWHDQKPNKKWLSHTISNPIQRLPRSPEFKPALPLVREALAISKHRSKIVAEWSKLAKSVRHLTRP